MKLVGRAGYSSLVTVVIVAAVVFSVGLAAAYWAATIFGLFTQRVERLELTVAKVTTEGSGRWRISIILRNAGTSTVTVSDLLLNGVPYEAAAETIGEGASVDVYPRPPFEVKPGDDRRMSIKLSCGTGKCSLKSGGLVEVKLKTASGGEYSRTLRLP